MNNSTNWEYIRHFVEVARAGSVIRAAAALGVSHATVLRNIARLEQILGIKLFDRLQSGYRISIKGEEIIASALAMQEHAEVLVRNATRRNPAPEGLLHLAIPDSSLLDLMPLVADFRTQFPLIRVHTLRSTDTSMVQSESDVAIVATNVPPEHLVGRQLMKIEFGYFASKRFVMNLGKVPSASACDWIIWCSGATFDADVKMGDWQEKALRRFTRQPSIVLQTCNHDDALSATRAGAGVCLLRKPQEDLIEMPFKPAVHSVGVWMLTHQDLRRAGRIQAFMDFAAERFS